MTGFCASTCIFFTFQKHYSSFCTESWMNEECTLFKGPKEFLEIPTSAVLSSFCGGCCLLKCSCPFIWKAAIIRIVLVCSTLLFFFLGFAETFQVSSTIDHVSSKRSDILYSFLVVGKPAFFLGFTAITFLRLTALLYQNIFFIYFSIF